MHNSDDANIPSTHDIKSNNDALCRAKTRAALKSAIMQ